MKNEELKITNFCVADFPFTVHLPGGLEADRLLPSFRTFRMEGDAADLPDRLFDFIALPAAEMPATAGQQTLLEETDNDMGHVCLYALADGYRVEVTCYGTTHCMVARPDFSAATAGICWEARGAGYALSSLLRITYAQAVLCRDAVSIHASAVHCDGRAYLFMGKSGTGKSTHSALWLRHIPGCTLLNDDNPVVRIVGNRALAYGTPWSGKTPCYNNVAFPIGGMVRLSQAPANRFYRREEVDAFVTLYPGCSVIAADHRLRNALYDTLTRLTALVTVGTLECLPDEEAALLCYSQLKGDLSGCVVCSTEHR